MYYLDMIRSESVEDFSSPGVLYNSKGDIVNEIFDEGNSLRELKDEKFTLIIDEEDANTNGPVRDKIPAFVQDAGAVFILSEKGCRFFKENGIFNLEFFNLTIKGKNIKLKDYKLVNIVSEKIECIDKERSIIAYNRYGYIKKVEFLSLIEEKVPKNLSIFLLGGFKSAEVFVRTDLKQKIEKTLTGFKFEAVEEFSQI
jgi:hypothetical protein